MYSICYMFSMHGYDPSYYMSILYWCDYLGIILDVRSSLQHPRVIFMHYMLLDSWCLVNLIYNCLYLEWCDILLYFLNIPDANNIMWVCCVYLVYTIHIPWWSLIAMMATAIAITATDIAVRAIDIIVRATKMS